MELILHCNRFVQKCEVCYCFNADIIANLNVLPGWCGMLVYLYEERYAEVCLQVKVM